MRKLKIPIGTAVYSLEFPEEILYGGGTAYGATYYSDKRMKVSSKQQKLQKLHTLLHEFLHAGLHEYGIITLDHDEEERIVEALSHALTMTLKNSKAFRELVLEGCT